MSCAAGRPTFRLLDRRVGWTDVALNNKGEWVEIGSVQTTPTVTAWSDPDGIQLLEKGQSPDQNVISAHDLLASLPPRRLARGCGPGSWLLLTTEGNVLGRDPCVPCWRPIWCAESLPNGLEGSLALASTPNRFAIVTPREVQVWTAAGETQVAAIPVANAAAVAFFPGGDVVVGSSGSDHSIVLARFGPDGRPLGALNLGTSVPGPISRLAVDVTGTIWLATGSNPAERALYSGPWQGKFAPATSAALAAAFPPTDLTGASKAGFCLQVTSAQGVPLTYCTSWDGCPLPASSIAPPPAPTWQKSGSITSGWIDSGIPRCRWHRVRVDASMPKGTGIQVSFVTMDSDPTGKAQKPSSGDWQQAPPGSLDVLVQLPPGRYLQLQLQLTSDGTTTPVVNSVRIDFPRRTSLDWLPAVYRENPEAEDFTARFLANFDASIDDLDAAVARFPALLDAQSVPGEVLPWLGTFMDVVFDPDWDDSLRRQVLAALPGLYKQRGTLAGLAAAIKLVFGITPSIQELAAEQPYGALAESRPSASGALVQPNATLGSVRLFSRSSTRFRLGQSALGAAPIHSYGNPDLDPITSLAYRFSIQVPRGPESIDHTRFRDLVESQKPAHTLATVRYGGEGFVVGVWSSVGIDTAFEPLPAPVIGPTGNVRLRRASLVAAGPPRGRLPLAVGVSSAVGVHTSLE
jgi:phage tail-like protein